MAKNGGGWRKFTWVILIFNVLMLVWILTGVGSVADNCEGEIGSALEACEAGTAIGAGLGAAFVIFLWVAGDVILGVIWLVTRKTQRTCPVCGTTVKPGLVVCKSCGHDFRLAPERS